MSFARSMPILEVRDVVVSIDFYERLGFAASPPWGDPPAFSIVQRGDVTLGLTRRETPALNEWWAAYLYVTDIEALHAEFTATGLSPTPISRPEHYGCDDFDVIDPDGHRLAFGQARNPVPAPGLSENRGRDGQGDTT